MVYTSARQSHHRPSVFSVENIPRLLHDPAFFRDGLAETRQDQRSSPPATPFPTLRPALTLANASGSTLRALYVVRPICVALAAARSRNCVGLARQNPSALGSNIALVLGDHFAQLGPRQSASSAAALPTARLASPGFFTFVDNIPHLLFALDRKPVAVLRIRLVYVACMPAARPTCGLAEGNRNSGRRLQPQCSSASSLLAPDGRRSFRGYSTTRICGPPSPRSSESRSLSEGPPTPACTWSCFDERR